ncbi:MAG: chromosome partitioning protein ParB [Flavobacteriales bacterium]|nr:MAG: chromosome partitioning protein ParB [Flavobacteriales bacterium]
MAKAVKKQALGRGLSALLRDQVDEITSVSDRNADKVVGNIVELSVEKIVVNPYQPRTQFHRGDLEELAASIKQLGVIQPITVRKLPDNTFQLVSGERRFRASKLVGLETIPAYIRIANDQEMLEMALVENIQRKDLDPIEVALSYQRLIDEIELTQEELSKRVGKDRSTVTNYLRLLKLDPVIQTGMRDGFLTMGHGRALIGVEQFNDQLAIYEKIVKNNLSVRQTEQLVKELRNGKSARVTPSTTSKKPEAVKKAEIKLTEKLGSKVSIKISKKGKGQIVIPFNSNEDFSRINNLLK